MSIATIEARLLLTAQEFAVDLADLDLAYRFYGVDAEDRSGQTVSDAGDVNGDGFDDLAVGASLNDAGGGSAGAAYIILGGNFTGSVTRLGTSGADTLTGTAAVDVFVGGTGDDVLIGNGGADVLRGGAGDDTLEVPDMAFRRADGGGGMDTLLLTGSGVTIDFTSSGNEKTGTQFRSLEMIDLNGGGNILRLTLEALGRISSSLVETDDTTKVHLVVKGDATDSVELMGGGTWLSNGTLDLVGVTYDRYDNQDVFILIAQAIAVQL